MSLLYCHFDGETVPQVLVKFVGQSTKSSLTMIGWTTVLKICGLLEWWNTYYITYSLEVWKEISATNKKLSKVVKYKMKQCDLQFLKNVF